MTLTVASVGDALSLDPAEASDNESMQIIQQVFDQLVRYKRGSTEVEPSLALRWEVSEKGTAWTFTLRRGVRFHDGTLMDADAVVFSFERQRDRAHPYHFGGFDYWESSFRQIVEVSKVDQYTVRFRLERPFAPFLANLTMYPASIVSPTAMRQYGRRFKEHPVGSGPFRFVGWERGRRIILARAPQPWGPRPRVDRLVYQVIPEAERRLASLESGTVDIVNGLDPGDRPIVALHPSLKLYRVPGENVAYLAMNTQRPPLHDVRTRRAINHAIDRRAIVKLVYQGLGVVADGPIPPTMWSYTKEVERYPYDPEAATRLLKESGFDFARHLKLYVMSTPRPYLPSPLLVARMIRRNLAQVGVTVELVMRPFPEHQKAGQRGEHDLFLGGWFGDNGDPDNFLYVLLDRDNARRGGARNVALFSDDRLHQLLIAAQQETNRQVRTRYYREAQEIVASQCPWVPLAHSEILVAARQVVHNFFIDSSAGIYFGEAEKQ